MPDMEMDMDMAETGVYSYEQHQAVSLASKFTGGLSVLGSCAIMIEIVMHRKQGTLHGILMGMSVFDILASLAFIVNTWAVPAPDDKDTTCDNCNTATTTTSTFQTFGNDATCAAQGFFIQLGAFAATLYSTSLIVHSFLVVNRSWKEPQLVQHQVWLFHLVPVVGGLGTALYGVIAHRFAPALLWCFFDSRTIFWVFYIPIWATFAAGAFLLLLIYLKVRAQELALLKYQFERSVVVSSPVSSAVNTHNNHRSFSIKASRSSFSNKASNISTANAASRRNKLSRPVLRQAMFYTAAFYLTFGFATVVRVIQFGYNRDNVPFALVFLFGFFVPLQGFLNCLVFKRVQIVEWFRHCSHRKQKYCGPSMASNNKNSSNAGSSSQKGVRHHPQQRLGDNVGDGIYDVEANNETPIPEESAQPQESGEVPSEEPEVLHDESP